MAVPRRGVQKQKPRAETHSTVLLSRASHTAIERPPMVRGSRATPALLNGPFLHREKNPENVVAGL